MGETSCRKRKDSRWISLIVRVCGIQHFLQDSGDIEQVKVAKPMVFSVELHKAKNRLKKDELATFRINIADHLLLEQRKCKEIMQMQMNFFDYQELSK